MRRLTDNAHAHAAIHGADKTPAPPSGCADTAAHVSAPIGSIVTVTVDRPLGSTHPNHPYIVYLVNYGFSDGIPAPDG